MPPSFLKASKFRNIECNIVPRDQSYGQLQVANTHIDGSILSATCNQFAFPHQVNGGGAIRIKQFQDIGNEKLLAPPLIRAHSLKINALSFSRFDANLLLSGSDDCTVKIWKVPESTLECTEDITTPLCVFRTDRVDSNGVVRNLYNHPTALGVFAVHTQSCIYIFDTVAEKERVAIQMQQIESSRNIDDISWNYNGSYAFVVTSDQKIGIMDPRKKVVDMQETVVHQGRRPVAIKWCGNQSMVVTAGVNTVRERELKLWDTRNMNVPVQTLRLDSSISALSLLYDDDLHMLYAAGKGDNSIKCIEMPPTSTKMGILNITALPHPSIATTLLPKLVCDTSECEIARILVLSPQDQGYCDILRYKIPRRNGAITFQEDLYPNTKASIPAMSGDEWWQGSADSTPNPILERINPKSKNTASNDVFSTTQNNWGRSISTTTNWSVQQKMAEPAQVSTWQTPNTSAPNQSKALATWTSPATTSPWQSGSADVKPAWHAVESITTVPIQMASNLWSTTNITTIKEPTNSSPVKSIEDPEAQPPSLKENENLENTYDAVADKAMESVVKYSHKFKYIQGLQAPRNEAFNLGDIQPDMSTSASNILQANGVYWALPIVGPGGPVLLNSLNAQGKAELSSSCILNQQKGNVVDLQFSPFHSQVLATASSDATIQIFSVMDEHGRLDGKPVSTLSGHTRSLRNVQFHPFVSNVLCSSSQDMNIKLWDVNQSQEQRSIDEKLGDILWQMEFNNTGPASDILATSSRDKVLRLFDMRSQRPLIMMTCGFDSLKPQFVRWISDFSFLSIGITAKNERSIRFWDTRKLSLDTPYATHLVNPIADHSIRYPFYDSSSKLLYLLSLGGRSIQSYEINPGDGQVQANLPFVRDTKTDQSTISGGVILPKSVCNVQEVEINRMLVLTPNTVEKISFSIPRTERLKAYFQDDLYHDIPCMQESSVLTADKYFQGDALRNHKYISLQPAGMPLLSTKPKETRPRNLKTKEFQAQIQRAEDEKILQAKNFEQLATLSQQPTLHSTHIPATQNGLDDSDSDSSWDD